jgi:hypothetical protein
MEEKLFNEVENLESGIDLGVEEETTEVDENHNDYEVTSYDHYDTDSEIEDDEESDGNLGKVLIVGAMVASAAAGAYLAPKIKKASLKGINWIKNKFSKEESEGVIVEVEEPKK